MPSLALLLFGFYVAEKAMFPAIGMDEAVEMLVRAFRNRSMRDRLEISPPVVIENVESVAIVDVLKHYEVIPQTWRRHRRLIWQSRRGRPRVRTRIA